MTDMITDHVKLPGVTAVLERPGARLVYQVSGDGPAVVLIHGFGLDMRMWDPQIGAAGGPVQGGALRLPRVRCSGPSTPASRTPTPVTSSRSWTTSASATRCWPACRSAAGWRCRPRWPPGPDPRPGPAGRGARRRALGPGVGPGPGRSRPAGPGGRGTGGSRSMAGPPAVRRRARAARPGRRAGGHGGGLPWPALAGPGSAPRDQAAHRRARGHRRTGPGRRGRAGRARLPRDVRRAGPAHPRCRLPRRRGRRPHGHHGAAAAVNDLLVSFVQEASWTR